LPAVTATPTVDPNATPTPLPAVTATPTVEGAAPTALPAVTATPLAAVTATPDPGAGFGFEGCLSLSDCGFPGGADDDGSGE